MTLKELNQKIQNDLIEQGFALSADGVIKDGGETLSALSECFFDTIIIRHEPKAEVKPIQGNYFSASWVAYGLPYLGMSEKMKVLNDLLVPEWRNEGLPGFKTLDGNDYAWCSNFVNFSFRKAGIKPTNNAGASSWRDWGKSCPYWFGAVLPIRHVSRKNHVTMFLYWIDEKKKIAACYGGNQGNHLSIAQYDLSGNDQGHDEVFPSPRWPSGWPDGQLVSREDVLSAYPGLKVGAVGGSTV